MSPWISCLIFGFWFTTIIGFVLLNATDGHMVIQYHIRHIRGDGYRGCYWGDGAYATGTGQPKMDVYPVFFRGLFGGLFGVAGAPIIYVVTIQPWKVSYIRQVMLTSFAVIVIIRLIWGSIFYGIPYQNLYYCYNVPAIVLATLLTSPST